MLCLIPQHNRLLRGGEHAAHQAPHHFAPCTDIRSVIIVVDVQDIRQCYRAGDGREHQLARGTASASDVCVDQAGSADDPRPCDPQSRSHEVDGGQGNAPSRATEEPGPPRIDDAIGRRFRGLRQSGQEITHLPPYAAAVLQATGTKQENLSLFDEV